MPQTSSNVTAGNDGKASDHNKVVADLAEIYAGGPGVPVGGVIWWWSDNSIPTNYKECNGQSISDGASALNGLTLPDLRDKFIRGVANANLRGAPVSGGNNSVDLTHSHIVNNHSHGGTLVQTGTDNQNHTHNGGNRTGTPTDGINSPHNHNYYVTDQGSAPGTSNSLTTISLLPGYRGLVPIMRYK